LRRHDLCCQQTGVSTSRAPREYPKITRDSVRVRAIRQTRGRFKLSDTRGRHQSRLAVLGPTGEQVPVAGGLCCDVGPTGQDYIYKFPTSNLAKKNPDWQPRGLHNANQNCRSAIQRKCLLCGDSAHTIRLLPLRVSRPNAVHINLDATQCVFRPDRRAINATLESPHSFSNCQCYPPSHQSRPGAPTSNSFQPRQTPFRKRAQAPSHFAAPFFFYSVRLRCSRVYPRVRYAPAPPSPQPSSASGRIASAAPNRARMRWRASTCAGEAKGLSAPAGRLGPKAPPQ
jgi:hypothetical protein